MRYRKTKQEKRPVSQGRIVVKPLTTKFAVEIKPSYFIKWIIGGKRNEIRTYWP
jgi:hypothetical protein